MRLLRKTRLKASGFLFGLYGDKFFTKTSFRTTAWNLDGTNARTAPPESIGLWKPPIQATRAPLHRGPACIRSQMCIVMETIRHGQKRTAAEERVSSKVRFQSLRWLGGNPALYYKHNCSRWRCNRVLVSARRAQHGIDGKKNRIGRTGI